MPAGLDTATAARSVISRAEQFVARWPGGYGRTLWQRVIMIQDEPADLAIGLWFACAGAQVQLFCTDGQPWVRERDDALMPRLRQTILTTEPRLLTHPLDGLQHDNYHRRWAFAYLDGSRENLAEHWTEPAEVVLIDGLNRLAVNPRDLLQFVHAHTQWSSSIEILPREGDSNVETVLEEVRRAAIEIGFGERKLPEGSGSGLSLVRLSAPMSDHPVLEDATIMAHCQARLDVAASLAKGRRILDAGGWAGLGAERYLKAGAEHVVNLDISGEALELGRSRLGKEKRVEFVRWDLNQTPLPFEDEAFDLVVCLEALEHIAEQQAAIAEFWRVLEPGGMLLISVPDRAYESTWERLNQHGNAYHLNVPSREAFEALLTEFEAIRWLRQTDVTGSLVFEERPRSGPNGGKFAVEAGWDARQARPQVVVALCTKPGGAEQKPKRRPRAVVTDLHVYTSQNDQIVRLREDEAAFQVSVRRERFDWWARANALEAQLRELQSGLSAARQEAEQWQGRVQTDEQIAALRARFDQTQASIEAITAALAADRARREQESGGVTEALRQQNELIAGAQKQLEASDRRWADKVQHQTNVINDAQRQRTEAETKLRESQLQLAQKSHQIERLTGELGEATKAADARAAELESARQRLESMAKEIAARDAAQAAALAANEKLQAAVEAARSDVAGEREQRQQTHAEFMQQLNRLSARLDDDRRTMLRRIEALLEQSLDQVDRRCLTVEGRVYDLEDELDRPAVSPHRNGSPST